MEQQDRVTGEVGPRSDSENGLHELVVSSDGDFVEAVDAPGSVTETTALSKFAKLDGWNTELVGVRCRHVAVLVLGASRRRRR